MLKNVVKKVDKHELKGNCNRETETIKKSQTEILEFEKYSIRG